MYLIVGLGNPGKKYEHTRHNVGFQVIDTIVQVFAIDDAGTKFDAQTYKGSCGNSKILLIKPQTFMNDSGKSVLQFINFYKIPIKNTFVIYDDIDMSIGKLRIKSGGGHGGHNGIKSINSLVSNEYIKIKIGVGHPGNKDMVSRYVLHPFETQEEQGLMKELYVDIANNINMLLEHNLEQFSSQINNK